MYAGGRLLPIARSFPPRDDFQLVGSYDRHPVANGFSLEVSSLGDPVKALLSAVQHIKDLQPLHQGLPALSEAERTLVQYIVHNPGQLATMSAAELALAAGVSEATVFRLCRHLQLGGYAALRDQVRTAVEKTEESFVKPVDVRHISDELGPVQSGAYVGIRALADAAMLDEASIQQAAAAIARARRISVCGMGAVTARIAELAAFGFQHLGLTVMLWVDSQVINVTPDKFQPGDVVLGISHSGANAYVQRFIELANDASATTVALTNYAASPVAQAADISLATSYREPVVQNLELLPRVSQLMVIQILINLVRGALAKTQRSVENG